MTRLAQNLQIRQFNVINLPIPQMMHLDQSFRTTLLTTSTFRTQLPVPQALPVIRPEILLIPTSPSSFNLVTVFHSELLADLHRLRGHYPRQFPAEFTNSDAALVSVGAPWSWCCGSGPCIHLKSARFSRTLNLTLNMIAFCGTPATGNDSDLSPHLPGVSAFSRVNKIQRPSHRFVTLRKNIPLLLSSTGFYTGRVMYLASQRWSRRPQGSHPFRLNSTRKDQDSPSGQHRLCHQSRITGIGEAKRNKKTFSREKELVGSRGSRDYHRLNVQGNQDLSFRLL